MIPAAAHIDVDLSVFSEPQRRELAKLLEGIKRGHDSIIGSLDSLPMNPASATPALRALLTQAQGAIPANAFEGWHRVGATLEPGFSGAGGWVDFDANGGLWFRKTPDGMVKIAGLIKTASYVDGAAVCTLPAGYRPGSDRRARSVVYNSSAARFGRLIVSTAGVVNVYDAAAAGAAVLELQISAEHFAES